MAESLLEEVYSTAGEEIMHRLVCENGHTFKIEETTFANAGKDAWYKYLLGFYKIGSVESDKLLKDYENLNEDEFIEEYMETVAKYTARYGIPEQYCPICKKVKEYEQDSDWNTYLSLKKKFNNA